MPRVRRRARCSVVDRRAWLAGLASLALGCSRRGCAAGQVAGDVDTNQIRLHEVSFGPDRGGPQKAAVLVPAWASADARLPLLIALHGRGEANRGVDVGAWAWVRDYWLDRCAARLRNPPLRPDDLLGLATPTYLDRLNGSLGVGPWQGLVVACPHTPDILGGDDLDAAAGFADFLVDHLIPEVRTRFPVIATREATGIDGVSLGGRMALLASTERPEAFGVVGTLQAAFRIGEVAAVAARVEQAWREPVHPRWLRVLTSEEDPFRPTLEMLATALGGGNVNVRYEVVPGPHDYDFNRGPGGFDMLLWHDRALRGREA